MQDEHIALSENLAGSHPQCGTCSLGSSDHLQSALLNILEDLTDEQTGYESVQRAVLNILEDAEVEKTNLESAQRAVLNILEDFDLEKSKVASINQDLQAEIEERQRVQVEINKLNLKLEQRVSERTADLAASNRELEAFSYSVSHDLRAPLRAMEGFSCALLEDYAERLDDEGRDLLQRIRAASNRMDRLIAGMLQLSRTSRSEVRRTIVDLSGLAQTVTDELRRASPERNVRILIAPGLTVSADVTLLRVVLENLLGNAWKFTSRHPDSFIEVGSVQQEKELAYFVRDDGAGFDMEYGSKLFEAFQRLHTPDEFEGTGIGLATVQRIVRRHGGRVWAHGQVEQGATFYFTLPEVKSGAVYEQ